MPRARHRSARRAVLRPLPPRPQPAQVPRYPCAAWSRRKAPGWSSSMPWRATCPASTRIPSPPSAPCSPACARWSPRTAPASCSSTISTRAAGMQPMPPQHLESAAPPISSPPSIPPWSAPGAAPVLTPKQSPPDPRQEPRAAREPPIQLHHPPHRRRRAAHLLRRPRSASQTAFSKHSGQHPAVPRRAEGPAPHPQANRGAAPGCRTARGKPHP